MRTFRPSFIRFSRFFSTASFATAVLGSTVLVLRSNVVVSPSTDGKQKGKPVLAKSQAPTKNKSTLPEVKGSSERSGEKTSSFMSLSPYAATSTHDPSTKEVWIVSNVGKDSGKVSLGHTLGSLKSALEKRGFRVRVVSVHDLDLFLQSAPEGTTREERIHNTKFKISRHGASVQRLRKEHLKKSDDKTSTKNLVGIWEKDALDLPRFVIARTGSNSKFQEYSLYRYLESLGVPVINSPISVNFASNKFLSYAMLAEQNVPVPKTILLDRRRAVKIEPKDILQSHKMKLPLVLKVLNTSGGRGVFLARDEKELSSLLRMAQYGASNIELVAQEFLEESKGMDVRVWVVGDNAYGACMRKNETDFRSNVGQGGFPQAVDLDEEGKQMAIRASTILGLDWSGVDLLLDHKDPVTGKCSWKIGEVNSSPGWDKDSDKLIDSNLGDVIIDHICKKYNIDVASDTTTHSEPQKPK